MSVRPAKTQISLGIQPVWPESSLSAQWVVKDPRFLHADSEDSDQTGRMPRLIWVFTVRTATLLVVMLQLILGWLQKRFGCRNFFFTILLKNCNMFSAHFSFFPECLLWTKIKATFQNYLKCKLSYNFYDLIIMRIDILTRNNSKCMALCHKSNIRIKLLQNSLLELIASQAFK